MKGKSSVTDYVAQVVQLEENSLHIDVYSLDVREKWSNHVR